MTDSFILCMMCVTNGMIPQIYGIKALKYSLSELTNIFSFSL